jgi:hypothetical protein
MIVIGGGLARLGHILPAELGPRAGVTGAAVLASDIAFAEAS